jgi:YbgC/YbaW family acyl-CoA thioester hydrolase
MAACAVELRDFRFAERLRVRWAEVDAQKIVFNGHYLAYFDTAMSGYWRALALPYADTMAQFGGDLFVRKATLEYEGSARCDELIDVGVRCGRIGTSSLAFDFAVFRDGSRLVPGQLIYVFADAATQRPQPVPLALRRVLEGYEGGAPVLRVEVGAWDGLGAHARPLRHEVFIDEQGVPAALEHDDADSGALHAVAFNGLGAAVATGRLLAQGDVVRIGRMAVRRTLRGSGIGRAVLDALLDAARRRGARAALLHAQTRARSFYADAGFEACGETFVEAGIEHIEMRRPL